MALYKRGNIWWTTFVVAGRRTRVSTKQSKEDKALRVESLMIAKEEMYGSIGPRKKAPLLRDFIPQFLEYNKKRVNIELKTKRYYASGVKLLQDSPLASMFMDGIRPVHLDTVSFGKSASNENMGRRTLSRLLNYASAIGLCSTPIKVPLLEEQGRDTLITSATEKAILNLGLQPLSDVLITILDAGMRPSEVLSMVPEYIRWELGHYQNPRGKTPRARRKVTISDRMIPILKKRSKDGKPLFHGVSLYTLDKQFAKARLLLDLPKSLKLYCARHTWATDVGALVGLAELQQAGGWSDSKTPMRYQHPGSERILQAVNARNASRAIN
jgi:integrase